MEYVATAADIQILRDWLVQVPHLPHDYNDHFLRFFIEGSKGRLELAKEKLDNFHKVRMAYPHMYSGLDIDDPEFFYGFSKMSYISLPPVLSKSGSLVIYVYPQDHEPTPTSVNNFYKQIFSYTMKLLLFPEFLEPLREKWNGSYIAVVDLRNITLQHVVLNTLSHMRASMECVQSVPLRVDGLHYCNLAPVYDKTFLLLKTFTKKKIADRIHIHRDTESLIKMIGTEALPSDYGGDLPSMQEIHEKELEFFQKNNDRILKWEEKANEAEKFRPKNAEDLIVGTFKKLEVD